MTNTTTRELTESSAFVSFLATAQAGIDAHYVGHPFPAPRLVAEPGRRYVRIVSQDTVSRSAWAFIDLNGAILKPDGWKRPAKGVRGNIHATNPVAFVGPTGPARFCR